MKNGIYTSTYSKKPEKKSYALESLYRCKTFRHNKYHNQFRGRRDHIQVAQIFSRYTTDDDVSYVKLSCIYMNSGAHNVII